MEYAVLIHRGGEPYWFEGAVAPGSIPERVIDLMRSSRVEKELELCGNVDCQQSCHCHVMMRVPERAGCYEHLCPVLFCDVVKPEWKVEDLV